jgi:hypothetical protein
VKSASPVARKLGNIRAISGRIHTSMLEDEDGLGLIPTDRILTEIHLDSFTIVQLFSTSKASKNQNNIQGALHATAYRLEELMRRIALSCPDLS